jgi:hypothetical protein
MEFSVSLMPNVQVMSYSKSDNCIYSYLKIAFRIRKGVGERRKRAMKTVLKILLKCKKYNIFTVILSLKNLEAF